MGRRRKTTELEDILMGLLILIGAIVVAMQSAISVIEALVIFVLAIIAIAILFFIIRSLIPKLYAKCTEYYFNYYFRSKRFKRTKTYLLSLINPNLHNDKFTKILYLNKDEQHILEYQKQINDLLILKQIFLLSSIEKQKYLTQISKQIPKIIKKNYSGILQARLGFYERTAKDIILLYSQYYFASQEFQQLKDRVKVYIKNCNELNAHINDLKIANLNAKQRDYGNVVSNNTSPYNYTRPHHLLNKRENEFRTANLTLYRNAENQCYKYFMKYFNIKANETSLTDCEDTLNAFYAIDEGKTLLKAEKNRILTTMGNDIPNIIKMHERKRLEHQLGFEQIGFEDLAYPNFIFRYESPGGRSSEEFTLTFNEIMLEKFIVYLSDEIQYTQSIKYQRALMSKKLRDNIKRRDNYTCQSCSNSTSIEPNLLLEIDHIVPLSKGGLSVEENLQTLCWRCNRSKGAKTQVAGREGFEPPEV